MNGACLYLERITKPVSLLLHLNYGAVNRTVRLWECGKGCRKLLVRAD